MSFKYIYSISDDFPNQKVNEEALVYEIRMSDITVALDYVYIRDQVECEIYFKAELSEGEQTLLDNIVYGHTGEPLENSILPEIGFQRMQIVDSDTQIVDVDDNGRLRVMASVIPKEHQLAGPEHLGQLVDDQIPSFIPRNTDLTTLSGILHQEVVDFASNYYDKTVMDSLLAEKAPLAHDHDLRYYKKIEVDSMLITTHSGLAGLLSDDHPQYLNDERGDTRYYTKSFINTLSGTLQTEINSKSDLGHVHNDIYYTKDVIDNYLDQKADINHVHEHKDLTGLTNDDHPQYLLIDGSRSIMGDLVIEGNLLVSGTQFISQTETVIINDNILVLNNGEVNQGVTAGIAGIEIDRGLLDNYRFLFSEHAKTFVVGISGSERPVVIRSTHDEIMDNYVPYFKWNTFDGLPFYELTTSGSLHINDVASVTYVDSTANVLQTEINKKADVTHTHIENDIVDLEHNAVKIRDKLVQAPTEEDDGKRLVYRHDSDSFVLEPSGYGGGGVSFPFSYFYCVSDPKESSTTDYCRWHTKLKLIVKIPAGKYRIGWNYQWALFNNNKEFMARVVIDDKDIMYHAQRPKYYRDTYYNSGFRYIDLEEGEHVIYLDYKPERRVVASIWNAELEFWRVEVK